MSFSKYDQMKNVVGTHWIKSQLGEGLLKHQDSQSLGTRPPSSHVHRAAELLRHAKVALSGASGGYRQHRHDRYRSVMTSMHCLGGSCSFVQLNLTKSVRMQLGRA